MIITLSGSITSTGPNSFAATFKHWMVTYTGTGSFTPAIPDAWSVPGAQLSLNLGLEDKLVRDTTVTFEGTVGESAINIQVNADDAGVIGNLSNALSQQYNITGNISFGIILDDPKPKVVESA